VRALRVATNSPTHPRVFCLNWCKGGTIEGKTKRSKVANKVQSK
jgi:hypothetical protein